VKDNSIFFKKNLPEYAKIIINKEERTMSATEVKEIVYHCQCRRFVKGTPVASCTCHECGREHVPTEE
ncbi:MAG: hypothetical protein Q8R70_11475, partial [Methanoregula sp.]|nr:hypothetical protein [Methanoregula sp.]